MGAAIMVSRVASFVFGSCCLQRAFITRAGSTRRVEYIGNKETSFAFCQRRLFRIPYRTGATATGSKACERLGEYLGTPPQLAFLSFLFIGPWGHLLRQRASVGR